MLECECARARRGLDTISDLRKGGIAFVLSPASFAQKGFASYYVIEA